MAETKGRKQSAFQNLRVRGQAVFDNAPLNEGFPIPRFKLFSAIVRVVGDGGDFFVASQNTLGNDPTLHHDSAGQWTLEFAAHTFTNYSMAIINTLDTHPPVTFDWISDNWFRFRTLNGSTPADNQVTFIRLLIIDFA
jgi:hypothetical protein